MPTRNLNILLFAILVSLLCHATYRRARPAMVVGDALDLIDTFYVDQVDRQELLTGAMRGMTESLDRHSEFVSMDDYGNLQDSINQEFTGIGILIEQPEPNSPVRIITPLVGSPAREAGLLPGDEIVEVDRRDVREWDLVNVSKRLNGPVNTQVHMVVRRNGERVPVTVRRSRIEMESVVGDHRDDEDRWVYRLQDDPRIAYLRLTSFGEKTVSELEQILSDLDNDFDAMVLDLRGNTGGLLYAAVAVSDMFLHSGRIVSTKVRGGITEEEFGAERGTLVDTDKPLAILIDGDSASASEIVAACLQDHDRAVVVGTRSYGKGTVQNILPLQYGRSALRLTVARYYRPNDKEIHRTDDATEEDDWGVRPNEGLEVELDEDTLGDLMERWRRSTYPMLARSEQSEPPSEPAEPSDTSTDAAEDEAAEGEAAEGEVAEGEVAKPANGESPETREASPGSGTEESILELDAQLRRAVEYLQDQLAATQGPVTAQHPATAAAAALVGAR